MRRLALVATTAACAAGLVGSALAGAQGHPQMRIVWESPLIVQGTQFRPRELVRVVVERPRGDASRRVRASASGRFTVVFPGLHYARCGTPPDVSAIGARSGRVTAVTVPRDCAAP